MIDWNLLWHDHLGITPTGAVGVVISTLVLYAVFALLMQAVGPRLMARPSVGSFVVLAVVGGITARATLGEAPTMLGALIALGALVVLEYATGRLRRFPFLVRRSRPIVVMLDGEPVPGALRRSHLTHTMLHDRLRVGGVLDLAEVALVILEVRGSLTVVRHGATINRALVRDVDGLEAIPAALLTD